MSFNYDFSVNNINTANDFINISTNYFNFVVAVLNLYKRESIYIPDKKSLFESNKIKENITCGVLATNYNNFKNTLLSHNFYSSHPNRFLKTVYQFGKFIRHAEKCFMYNNSDSNTIFAEDKDEKTFIIYFCNLSDNFRYKITFEKTEISNMNSSNLVESYISNKSTLNIIEVEIKRDYGKHMKTTFRFIEDEEPMFNNISDKILYELFMNKTIEMMSETFDQVLDSIVPLYTNNSLLITWKEVMKNGFRIRK